jgi:MFS transporter, SP family, sugar:H+ symporter
MPNFLRLFGNEPGPAFSNLRSGTIVALLSIGTLIGAIVAAPIADAIGRKYSIVFWNIVFCIGMIVQIATVNTWYQIAIGRWVAGLGVGGLRYLLIIFLYARENEFTDKVPVF